MEERGGDLTGSDDSVPVTRSNFVGRRGKRWERLFVIHPLLPAPRCMPIGLVETATCKATSPRFATTLTQ